MEAKTPKIAFATPAKYLFRSAVMKLLSKFVIR